MIEQSFLILFHLLSTYLSFQDFKNQSVSFMPYCLCTIVLLLYIISCKLIPHTYWGIIAFTIVVVGMTFLSSQKPIAIADVIYAYLLLWLLDEKFYIYFIIIGFLSLVVFKLTQNIRSLKKENNTSKIPFLPVLYGAYVICYYLF